MRSQSSALLSVPECPKCKQSMRWHSLRRAKSLEGLMETNVFHCEGCDRYIAQQAQVMPLRFGRCSVALFKGRELG